MIKQCAWCNNNLGLLAGEPDHPNKISYGICEECLDSLIPEEREKLTTFLDSIPVPVIVIVPDGRVVTANSFALKYLGKELGDIDGSAGGDVFECAYASLPDGCGKTEHCSGCTIRKTVMDTFMSGKSHVQNPAYLKRGNPCEPHHLDLTISTEKVNDVVLLRIDRIVPQ